MKGLLRLGGGLLVILFMWACSASQPKILLTFSQLSYYQDSRDFTWRECLSVFVNLENKDGIQEFDKIHILADNAELYWELTPDSWQTINKDNQTWVGNTLLLMPGQDLLPRGNYRIVATTKAGNRAESTFNVNSISLRDYKEPLSEVYLYKDQILLSPPKDSFLIWSFSRERKILQTFKATGGQVSKAQLLGDSQLKGQASTFFVYSYDESKGIGFLSGPFLY